MLTDEQKKMTRAEKEREAMRIMSELPAAKRDEALAALFTYLEYRDEVQKC